MCEGCPRQRVSSRASQHSQNAAVQKSLKDYYCQMRFPREFSRQAIGLPRPDPAFTQGGRGGINIWICTPSSYPDYKLSAGAPPCTDVHCTAPRQREVERDRARADECPRHASDDVFCSLLSCFWRVCRLTCAHVRDYFTQSTALTSTRHPPSPTMAQERPRHGASAVL
jgi:hypothetical protein